MTKFKLPSSMTEFSHSGLVLGVWVLVVMWLVGWSDWLFPNHVHAEITNRIIAFVNDDVITEGDVSSQVEAILSQEDAPKKLSGDESNHMWLMMLQRLVGERLMIQEAKRLSLSVAGEEVRERLDAIKARLGSPEEFAAMLQRSQLNEEQLRNKIREQLLAQKAIDQQVRDKIVITSQEIAGELAKSSAPSSGQRASEQIRAYHLLIRITDGRPAEAALELVNELKERLAKGEDPGELSKRYSEDPEAQDGGLMDWVSQGQLLPELDEALFRLQAGETSPPIKTSLGYHVLKVVERKVPAAPDAATARRAAEQRLYEEKFKRGLTAWLNELKQRAYIRVVAQ